MRVLHLVTIITILLVPLSILNSPYLCSDDSDVISKESSFATSGESSWLTDWQYRKSHNIEGSLGAGENYQIRLTLYYGSGTDSGSDIYLNGFCRSDFSDIRFTDDDGITLLDHWREIYTTSDYAIFWVEVIDNLDINQTIYIYYGNNICSSASDGFSTFIFFDDFENDTIGSQPDSSRWTVSGIIDSDDYVKISVDPADVGNQVLENRESGDSIANNAETITWGSVGSVAIGQKLRYDVNYIGYQWVKNSTHQNFIEQLNSPGDNHHQWYSASGYLDYTPSLITTTDTWYSWEYRISPDEVTVYDWDNFQSHQAGLRTAYSDPIQSCARYGFRMSYNTWWTDDMYVRKYVPDEPTSISCGSFENTNWLYGWQQRKYLNLLGSIGAGENYQVKLNLHYESGTDSGSSVYLNGNCQSDFGDVRFTDDDGVTLLDYWMEELNEGDTATVWVEVADTLDVDQTVYLYYGNTEAESISNGTATFIAFDDFETDLSKWQANHTEVGDTWELAAAPGGRSGTVGHLQENPTGTGSQIIGNHFEEHANIAVHYKFYWEHRAYQLRSEVFGVNANGEPLYSFRTTGDTNYDFAYIDSSGSVVRYQVGLSAYEDTWYDIEYKASSAGKTNLTIDGTTYAGENYLSSPTKGFKLFRFYGWGKNGLGDEFMLDDYYVRKYIYNEPAVSSSGAVENLWLAGLQYRKAHNITGAVGSGSNYQIAFDLQYGSGTDSGSTVYLDGLCRSDFGDVRFTDDDGVTLLDYWMEEMFPSDNATFWVEVNDTLDVDQSIYLYYGNPTAESISDGDATFLFFDDFNTDLDLTKWNMTSGDISTSNGYLELISTDGTRGSIDGKVNLSYNTAYTVRGYANGLSTQNTHLVELRTGDPENVSKIDSYGSNSANYFYFETGVSGSFHGEYTYFPSSITDQHSYTLFREIDTATWYQDSSQVHSTSTLVPDIDLQPCLTEGSISGEIWYIDHLYIRNWNPNIEPSHGNWSIVETFDSGPPLIITPDDLIYERDSVGNYIIWNCTDDNPETYSFYINGSLDISEQWQGDNITLSVDGLQLGTWKCTMVVNDSYGNNANASSFITVVDTISPILENHEDITMELGMEYGNITWKCSDLRPANFTLFFQNESIESGLWDGQNLTVEFGYLEVGVYNYTVSINDTVGNEARDTVMVTVVDTCKPILADHGNVDCELGTANNFINWSIIDEDPDSFVVTIDGESFVSGTWESNVTISLHSFDVGQYEFNLTAFDSSGNNASDIVVVTVVDTTAPVIDETVNIEYELGSINNILKWTAFDLKPDSFTLRLDGNIHSTGYWTTNITLSIDGLDVGQYEFNLTVFDTSGNRASALVIVTVVDTTPPVLSSPEDIIYEFETSGHNITWQIIELDPGLYTILINGTIYKSDSWNGDSIQISIDGLEVGSYIFNITVVDASGNAASDIVIVRVFEAVTPPIMTIIVIVGVGGGGFIAIIIVVRKRKSSVEILDVSLDAVPPDIEAALREEAENIPNRVRESVEKSIAEIDKPLTEHTDGGPGTDLDE